LAQGICGSGGRQKQPTMLKDCLGAGAAPRGHPGQDDGGFCSSCDKPNGFIDANEQSHTKWRQVGENGGDYEMVPDYRYVGEGCGSFEKETTTTYYGWRIGRFSITLLVLLVLFGIIFWIYSTIPSFDDSTTPPPEPVFDCNAGFANWEAGWAVDKKDYCCLHTGRACPANTTTTAVPAQPFDCEAGYANWMAGWSEDKKAFCCDHYGRGCTTTLVVVTTTITTTTPAPETTWLLVPVPLDKASPMLPAGTTPPPPPAMVAASASTSMAFDCGAGTQWIQLWADQKKDWCCKVMGKACDVRTPAPTAAPVVTAQPSALPPLPTTAPVVVSPYDCNAGIENWQAGWSEPKKTWCCENTGKACPPAPTTTSGPYDCDAGFLNWESGWSDQKKAYCCQHTSRGCPFDCNLGFDNWEVSWTVPQQEFCCQHARRGCPGTGTLAPTTTTTLAPTTTALVAQFDCAAAFANWQAAWSPEKKSWCCANAGLGCAPPTPTQLPAAFDCSAGFATWEVAWSGPQKEWCCQQHGRGCARPTQSAPFDCAAGLANWADGWSPAKKTWCCANMGQGCR